jgi:hypothetical protein
MAEVASVGPKADGISSVATGTTAANGNRNSRLASGCSGESHNTTVGRRYVAPSDSTSRGPPR